MKKDIRYEPKDVYRPDPPKNILETAKLFNLIDDVRTFFREVRTRFRITCPSCGRSQRILPRQAPLAILPCSCGYFPSYVEYPRLFSQRIRG